MRPWLALLLALAPAAAQTVDEIVAHNLAARGGLDRIRAVTSKRIAARQSSDPDGESTLLIEQRRGESGPQIRISVTLDGVTLVRAFDGVRAWSQLIPAGRSPLPPVHLAGDEVSNLAEDAEFDGPLVDWRARGITVRYDGRAPLGGREAYKLMVRLKDGNVFYYYLDPATWLETRTVGGRDTGGREVLIESQFRDYRRSGGQMVAFRVDSQTPETGRSQSLTVDRIDWNPGIPESRFRFPSGSSAPLGSAPAPRLAPHAAD